MVASMIMGSRRTCLERTPSAKADRVPQTLQTILIIANRGKEVNKPPPGRVAQRTFRRFFTKRGKNVNDHATAEHDDSSSDLSMEHEIPKSIGGASTKGIESIPPPPISTPSAPVACTKHHVSPQAYVTSLLKNRGYSDAMYKALETGYYNKPTPFQVASHGTKVIETIRSNNVKFFKEIMDVGLSPNACNEHGESIVHMICRMGHKELFEILLDHGMTVQVCDDYGRTPLHDACWSTCVNFELVDLIMERDPRLLFVRDSRGSLPLQYLPETQWTEWTKYLMSRKDRFWPERCIRKEGMQQDAEMALIQPHSRPVPNPKSAAPLELAKLVAQGRMSPMEATILKDDDLDSTCGSDDCDSCSDDEDDSDYQLEEEDDDASMADQTGEEDDDSSAWSESAFDEKEMEDILGCLGKGQAIAWSS